MWGSSLLTSHLPSLAITGSTLPTPGAMAAWGSALLLLAVLAFIFLHAIRLALYLGAGGLIVLMAASVAFGYEEQGRQQIMPQVLALQAQVKAANDEAAQFKAAAALASQQAAAAVRSKRAAVAAAVAPLRARIAAQDAAIRNLSIPADAGVLLQPAIDAVNATAATAAGASGGAAAAAAVAGPTTLGQVEQWAGTVIGQYGDCVAEVKGLQDYANGAIQAAAKAVAVPANP